MKNLSKDREQNLDRYNEIVYDAKIHWISFILPIIFTVLGILGLLSFTFTIGFFKIISLALTVLLFKGVLGILQLKFTKILITKRFLTVTTGIINRTTVDISLHRVEGKKIYQSFLGRIFNYGRVYVSTGEITKSFVIEDPNNMKNILSEAF
ncbi:MULTISPECIES: PH domain-containing protein [Elizabethkingia]|uniref:YdbS-like PH domain-containing protein n=1 Tax=Elizabethkingia anophelis R26 TaxID=1246994 RepID=A0ABM6MWV4_9FLAO|nr:PH domain-containing protein [Elizabethkingia anophelis]ATC37730.1 hypothetical protein BAZ09_016435 [Elizabethkingia anophelis R26]ATC41410.1 hypothetical protein EAAG1_016650 [Elizabethkingia anophelis Ag1]ATC45087.1 hypothetical protein CMV41_16650 [Elizabethkingia anophelis]ATC48763.1 hypothetical protein CMV40_16650 [Elizabethkingia anophelis]ELR81218.1 membrane protein [Elizabethkingia anophelis R26]